MDRAESATGSAQRNGRDGPDQTAATRPRGAFRSRVGQTDRMDAPRTVERWCRAWIECDDPVHKHAPPSPPDPHEAGSWEVGPRALRIERPGRPAAWKRSDRSPRTPKLDSLGNLRNRALLVHTFLHHELQAAELFAWAVLAFPETPKAFRAGLLGLCRSELEHLALYREHLDHLGYAVGDFAVRDWFWERVGSCTTPLSFVALLGLGLEGANLEHSARFAAAFRAVGDERGAAILERVEREEIAHVSFAAHWFERLGGVPLSFDAWCAALPAPITPSVLRGKPLNRRARRRAGLDEAFLARLELVGPATGSTEART